METILVNTELPNLKFHIGAADECSLALRNLGFGYHFSVKGSRGSHGAQVWVSEEYKDKFEKDILPNVVEGTYRKFFFSKSGEYFYYVSYSSKY
jgi:hypothetical protein